MFTNTSTCSIFSTILLQCTIRLVRHHSTFQPLLLEIYDGSLLGKHRTQRDLRPLEVIKTRDIFMATTEQTHWQTRYPSTIIIPMRFVAITTVTPATTQARGREP
jgi:hypothetical protein